MMNSIYMLKDMLMDELEPYSQKGSISRSDLETVNKLTETIKNLDKIEMVEAQGHSRDGYSRDDYSRDGDWTATGSYGRGNSYADSYEDGRSGRMHYVRGHYSRAEDGRTMFKDHLNEMMSDSRLSNADRETLRKAKDILDK